MDAGDGRLAAVGVPGREANAIGKADIDAQGRWTYSPPFHVAKG